MSIISWFRTFNKSSPQTFESMTPADKKKFLSNDLIERMIRVEQRVSSKMGSPVHYKSTQYYKSLTQVQRNNFERHLRHKSQKLFLLSLLALSSLLGVSTITGNAISDVSSSGPKLASIFIIFAGIFLIALLLRVVYERKIRHERLSGVHNLIEKTIKH